MESVTLFDPRIRTRVPPPVVPPLDSTSTPGARALSRSVSVFGVACCTSFGASSFWTAFPSSRLRCSPVAVTMISSSATAVGVSSSSVVVVWPALTVTALAAVPYPMRRARSCTSPAAMSERRNSPLTSLNARCVVPATSTCAPTSGRLVVGSSTRPLIDPVPCCAAPIRRPALSSSAATAPRRTARILGVWTDGRSRIDAPQGESPSGAEAPQARSHSLCMDCSRACRPTAGRASTRGDGATGAASCHITRIGRRRKRVPRPARNL